MEHFIYKSEWANACDVFKKRPLAFRITNINFYIIGLHAYFKQKLCHRDDISLVHYQASLQVLINSLRKPIRWLFIILQKRWNSEIAPLSKMVYYSWLEYSIERDEAFCVLWT